MKLATWNVNSVRAREARLLAFLDREAPDVLCLQELKGTEDTFPHEAVTARGYHAAIYGQRTYNGVAILSRTPPEDVAVGFRDDEDEDPQARLVWATVDGVRVCSAYFPNGQKVGSDKWAYKLAWIARLRRALDRLDPEVPFAIAGDFNVAPGERDVAFEEIWRWTVLCHPEARTALENVRAWGLEDTVRRVVGDVQGPYSWWDYRALAFPKGDGLRIDHVFATPALAAQAIAARVDRDERKGDVPSDHAPVIVEFSR